MKSDCQITVLIVDDHPVVREGYRILLESTHDAQAPTPVRVIAEADNGQQAYESYIQHQPDIVIMDISLPDKSGLDATSRILQREPAARILVFSIHENPILMRRAKEIGAKGYLTKRSAPRLMTIAVHLIAQGQEYFDENLQNGQDIATDPINLLSQREFEVFLLLAKGKSVNRIAELLHVSSKTVGVHYTRIMRKLEAESTAFLARLAIRHELILP